LAHAGRRAVFYAPEDIRFCQSPEPLPKQRLYAVTSPRITNILGHDNAAPIRWTNQRVQNSHSGRHGDVLLVVTSSHAGSLLIQ